MSEQEKKHQIIHDLDNVEIEPKKFRNNWSFFMSSIDPRP